MISPTLILAIIAAYFLCLVGIAWVTGRNATSEGYFLGNKNSPWWAVGFGLIGDSLSGVTFISLPGTVVNDQFGYMQVVLGYLLGYGIIAYVLLPLYYRLNLVSIYSYLGSRFGTYSQQSGSFFFLISRLIGAALRLYLAAGVIQLFVFDPLGVPFSVSVALIIILILLYTYRGGIKTLVWTDTLQSMVLLLGMISAIYVIMQKLDWSFVETVQEISASKYSKIFFFDDFNSRGHFVKQFLSGAFIAIVMTGLDQNMMQKNLSMKTLPEAQKNIISFSFVLVIVNLLFVALGALLFIYGDKMGINFATNPETGKIITDKVFPFLALNHLGAFACSMFILGLTAATFSSADSVLTTLTTSFTYDFLKFETTKKYNENQKLRIRQVTHIGFAVLLLLTILVCEFVNKTSVLDAIFTVAAFTYGPLLGLFVFGLYTKTKINDKLVPLACLAAPAICYVLRLNSETWFNGYKFGYELLLLNGLLTVLFLSLLRKK